MVLQSLTQTNKTKIKNRENFFIYLYLLEGKMMYLLRAGYFLLEIFIKEKGD